MVEHSRQSLDGHPVAVLVQELEVVTRLFGSLLLHADNIPFLHPLRQEECVGLACEYLIRMSLIHTHHCYPVLAVVFETHNFGIQFLRTLGCAGFLELLLLRLCVRHQYSVSRPLAVYRASLAARLPRRHIYLTHHLFARLFWYVHRHTYRMVNPFLYLALHLNLVHPVYICRRGLIVGRFLYHRRQIRLAHRGHLVHIIPIHLQPVYEFRVKHIVFLKQVSALVFYDAVF